MQVCRSTPVDSIYDPPFPAEELSPLENTKTFDDRLNQYPISDPAVVQEHYEAILDLRSRIKREEQNLHALQEELSIRKFIVGSAEPPAHMKIQNLFDDQSLSDPSVEHYPGSPGGKTLAESRLAMLPQAGTSHSSTAPTMFNVSQEHLVPKNDKPDDVPTMDMMLETNPQQQHLSSPAMRKRKRCSRLSVTKKARTNGNSTTSDLPAESDNLLVPSIQVERVSNERVDHVPSNPPHLDDGDTPSRTSRPVSWPRNRLFRRSAGVSIMELTEIFKEMRVQHDKH
ncbi:MAG: hypothetical protein LQ350_003166 [Teloschistes chrysophthalmus]|nr:MAG: hypothetical protein LQ350_003166 [Niorma chrysophthalma]